jgi:putative ABC transport system permease protein
MAEDKPVTAPEDAQRVYRHHVSPDGLNALGMPILKGRGLSPQDTLDTPLVAVVSQSMAEALWPGEDPIGKRFLGAPSTPMRVHEVVGVVADVKHRGRLTAEGDVTRDYYCSFYQYPIPFLVVYVVGKTDSATLVNPLRKMLRSIDPDLAIYSLETARERLDREEAEIRLTSLLMTAYAAMALTLAALGIYGVLAYAVGRRTNEIGVRMALGADRKSIYREVVGQAMTQVLIGLVLGVAGAVVMTRVISSLLYQVTATDPATFVTMTVAFLMVALLASFLPARRAMTVDPVKALRFE